MCQWVEKNFVPSSINVVSEVFPHFMIEQVEKWFRRNQKCPAGHNAIIKFYGSLKLPLDVFSPFPIFQLEYGPRASLPFISTSSVASSLEEELLLLTKTTDDKKCKAIVMANSLFYKKAANSKFHCNIADLKLVTYFDAIYCRQFHSAHLEQVAIACPNLEQLSIQGSDSLKSLQGLHSIALNCEKLQGLNLLGISVCNVENHFKLWKILSKMKLTTLMIDLCLIKPNTGSEQNLASVFKNIVWLKVLTIVADDYCDKCNNSKDGEMSFLSYFPVLTYCELNSLSCRNSIMKSSTNCKKIEYFYLSCYDKEPNVLSLAPSCELRQLSIFSKSTSLTETFMEAVSAHGRLEHIVLVINSVTIDGIVTLVKNSPMLITCRIITVNDEQSKAPNFEELKSMLKKKYCTRKLFTAGSYQFECVEKRYRDLLQGTEFSLPLWTFWRHYSPSHWCGTCSGISVCS